MLSVVYDMISYEIATLLKPFAMQHSVTTCFSFNKNAEEAIRFYVDLFDKAFGSENGGSKILKTTRFGEEEIKALANVPDIPEGMQPGPAGSVKTIRFQLNGKEYLAVNGGGYFGQFNESVSLYVSCDSQKQIDILYDALAQHGEKQPCGWVKDRFGLSWQITPHFLWEMDECDDEDRSQEINKALYKMNKIDMEKLWQVWNGKETVTG